MSDIEAKQETAKAWFKDLRNSICETFEDIERDFSGRKQAAGFERKAWDRPEGGGGTMSIMRGRVFEKVGVNISTVWGEFSDQFKSQIQGAEDDPRFWASGISLVAHMASPKVPAVHMNTRMIVTTKNWFGGGADLTPMIENADDKMRFHKALEACCDRHPQTSYQDYKDWCDRYFYLPHRKEPRGVGGIFFDSLNRGDWEKDFAFVKDVGTTFRDTYAGIVRDHMHETWTPDEREQQLYKRGRYVEFNLLHDRGTLFGLKTGGNVEAILMSLPPEVKWA